MKYLITLFALITLPSVTTLLNAENIKVSSLGKFKLEYMKVKQSNIVRGNQLVATVSEMSGQAFILNSPTNIQQTTYLINNGDFAKKDQPFAVLRGPEVHHFITEYKVAKQLLELTKKRFLRNQKMFKDKLIDESKWLTISQNYFETMLEFEHMHHFYELIETIDEDNDSITVKAPIEGFFVQSDNQIQFSEDDMIARFVPKKSIRLKLQVPTSLVDLLTSVESNSCTLRINKKNNIALGAFIEVWTESLSDKCNFILGQQIMVHPFFQKQAFLVPKSAVFSLNGEDKILVKNANELTPVNVSLLTSVDNNYLLSSQIDITDSEVLTTSVSAAQGILIGLGDE